METQVFHHAKILYSKNPLQKKNQNPSRYYNSIITNLKFQPKPKYHLSKILISKQTYYTCSPYAIILYNESKHNIRPTTNRWGKKSR
jgi:hypothetical protein